ncbi:hypothetical protein [Sphingopyxis terrae]|uniref:hypothetical protein n=1 Tax=Sphingopyxis terrae TaxID=33052 RepID=UPI00364295C4
MRLEKLYPGSAATEIAAHVPQCARGWARVTLEQALDMTTGHYRFDAIWPTRMMPGSRPFSNPRGMLRRSSSPAPIIRARRRRAANGSITRRHLFAGHCNGRDPA